MKEIKAVVGTNSWGSKVYGQFLHGSYVDETVINMAVKIAMELGLYVFDTAQDCGIYIVQPVADILSVIFAVLVVIFSWNKIFED